MQWPHAVTTILHSGHMSHVGLIDRDELRDELLQALRELTVAANNGSGYKHMI